MSFEVAADAYGRFMGRYAQPLAIAFADLIGVREGQRALDVGCGPGALTTLLVDRLGADDVTAIDPSPTFVDAVRTRLPGVAIELGGAEDLPFADASFDLVLAQLVVQFMTDPLAGLAEMARVARPGATVGATVWDHSGERGPLSLCWRAIRDLDPSVRGEGHLAGVAEGGMAELFEGAGMAGPTTAVLSVPVVHPTFEEWWEPYTLGVGPVGDYVQGLDDVGRAALRSHCEELLPPAPFTIDAAAWTVTWVKPAD